MNFRNQLKQNHIHQNNNFKHRLLKQHELNRVVIDGDRYYKTPDNNQYISITTLLSKAPTPWLDDWINRVGKDEAKRISTNAASRGEELHEMCEHYLLCKSIDTTKYSPIARLLFDIIRPELDKIQGVFALEYYLWSDYLKLAGTVDLVCLYDNLLTVVDFKTSLKEKKIDWISSYFVQASAYARMIHEVYGIKPKQLLILIVNERGGVQRFMLDEWDVYDQKLLEINKEFNPCFL